MRRGAAVVGPRGDRLKGTVAMEKRWYVLQALSGKENKVLDWLQRHIQLDEVQEYVDEVLIPTEKVSEVRNGKKNTRVQKMFPGYVLIHMALYGEEGEILEKPWQYIQDTPELIGFVGNRQRPKALTEREVEDLLNQLEEKKDQVKPKVNFEPGEAVKVTDGAFLGQEGIVEEVNPEQGKLKVNVTIFDREVPVELEYWQVERGEQK